jgi:hypothetical protein
MARQGPCVEVFFFDFDEIFDLKILKFFEKNVKVQPTLKKFSTTERAKIPKNVEVRGQKV